MADPLSITASVVGITGAALQAVRFLLDELRDVNDAPKTIKRLADDVQSVDAALRLLQGIEDREWNLLGTSIVEQSKTTVSNCTQACQVFRTDLQRWTRRSQEGKLAWRDRTKVGFLKQGQIKAMSEQLQNCKLTISNVVSIAVLYSSVRHSHITEEIRNSISKKQGEVESAIATANKQLILVESKLEELSRSSDNDETVEPTGSKADVAKQLEEGRKALNVSRELLNELLAKAQEEVVANAAARNQGSSITITFGTQNLGVQAYTINGGVNFRGH
ncbi:hypothetical protein F5884DRAFT_801530 [Xylogone sp. PMI_703]|nr:hypothetical protein F5884DRAFT_801530 [Xylogone sp. PMI_703]